MSSTLGEKLRQAREARGVSISEVAEQTRISPQYLHSIENDDYKPLPGGIFNKGFVKSYARYIGYDEHAALQEYSQIIATNDASAEEEFKSYRPEVLTDDRASGEPLATIIFAGVILTLMTVGILYVVRYVINQPESTPVATTNSNTNVNAGAAVPVEETAARPTNDNSPSMDSLKVEFRTASNPISLSSISDGKSAIMLITPEKPASFEPRQALRLAYSKSLASSAQLLVNGRSIALPQQPASPKRAAIEIELNAGNLPQVWQSSTIEPVGAPAPAATAGAARPPARPTLAPANTSTTRPANAAAPASSPARP